jgi:hypothetical protein
MADFDATRQELSEARDGYGAAADELAARRVALRRAEEERRRAGTAGERHDERVRAARDAVERAAGVRAEAGAQLEAAVEGFAPLSDPRKGVERLDDGFPCLLFPLRLETRFKAIGDGTQLWVRVFPDTCLIDTFEPTLSEVELAGARAYWREIWRAGGVEADERAAWRGLVASHGSGRAAWIVDQYRPANEAEAPVKVAETDVILVVSVEAPLPAAERTAVATYWRAHWRADGAAAGEQAALTALVADVGAARAAALVELTRPFNLDDRPAPPLDPVDVVSSVRFVVLPDVPVKDQPWTRAPKVDLLPERLVLILEAGTERIERLGEPVPSPLIVGPDPLAPPAEQLHQQDGDLVLPEELRWMADFERAVADGLGFKVDLTPEQTRRGFDRLAVLGVRLCEDGRQGRAALETLLDHHHHGRSGLSLVPQGTPTNNTEGAGSGFTRDADADATFDERRQPALFAIEADSRLKRDGQWLAELLGIDPAVLAHVTGSSGLDQRDARAMQTALWPATLGYFLATMMDPLVDDADIEHARWYFTRYVSGRGAAPAIRIGDQPYGVLATTAFSRIDWLRADEGPTIMEVDGRLRFLRRLFAILRAVDGDWAAMARQAPAVSRSGDAHQSLLGILGLHPASVEFHYRYAQSLEHLYNHINFLGLGNVWFQALLRAALDRPAEELLRRLGHSGAERPAVLGKYFLGGQGRLRGPLVDDRPLSETEPVRAWTADQRSYLRWLIDAAGSLETLRLQPGFLEDRPPATLLYLLLRHALILGYADAGRFLHRTAGFDETVVSALKREPAFVHVDTGAQVSESRWAPLYKVEPAITVGGTATVAEHIGSILHTASETASLREQVEAIGLLEDASTARLERALVEHVDCCTYRFDAWLMGLVGLQLETMRAAGGEGHENGRHARRGAYLGAYGWLEDVRRKPRELTPVELPADLVEAFGGPDRPPLMRDSANGGYIHAPSLNHAVTAAVLRSGYLSNASPGAPDAMAVNLSSERVRRALGVLEGIRNGQSMASLLGYRLERGLHDRHAVAEVDRFVFALRKAFPLRADRLSQTATPPGVAIEAIEARNVVDGLRLVEHVKRTGARAYPFGISSLPGASNAQRGAIDAEVDALLDVHDAIADLALAEGVHQAVQGNFDRAGGTLAAYTTGSHPPEPEVVRTPATGVTLTHRVGLHLRQGLPAPAGATPRAVAEPAVNDWLEDVLPRLDEIACRVRWKDPLSGTDESRTITMSQLGLQPLDLLELVRTEDRQAMTELDDRVLRRVLAVASPRPDAVLEIRYMEHGAGQLSVFEAAPLVAHLRALIAGGRALRAGDVAPPGVATQKADETSRMDRARIAAVKAAADPQPAALGAYLAVLDPLLADQPNRRQDVLDGIDGFIDDAVTLLARAARLGVPQTGWGFALAWRRDRYADLVARLRARVKRWDERLTEFGERLDAYDLLPGTAPADERFGLLRQAESLVSTVPEPLPPQPDDLRDALDLKGQAFEDRRDDLSDVAEGSAAGLSDLLADVAPLLPLTAFDSEPFELGELEDGVIVFARELTAVITGTRAEIQRRVDAAQEQLDAHDAAGPPPARLEALRLAAQALLGEGVVLVPEFALRSAIGDDLEDALDATDDLLEYLHDDTEIELPVDEWLYGVARVRPAVRHLEQTIMLAGAFERAEPELTPAQLPHRPGERWLALDFPADQAIDGERLLYTAAYTVPFAKAAAQCGLLLDEWTEVIPGEVAGTGITFHYDQPSSEAPQTLLLVTPATWDGTWHWEDLVGALGETLELARKRAVEPSHVDASAYARFLPATITAATLHGISIAIALALNNDVHEFVRTEGPG